MRATPQWDDGKVARCRQYEVAQEKPGCGRITGMDALLDSRKSDRELILGEFKAVEVADDRGCHASGLKEFAGELLDVFYRDAF